MKMYKMVLGKEDKFWSFHNIILPLMTEGRLEYKIGKNICPSDYGLYFFKSKGNVAKFIEYLLNTSSIAHSIKSRIEKYAKGMDMYLVEAEVKKEDIISEGVKAYSYNIPYFLVKEADIENISKVL